MLSGSVTHASVIGGRPQQEDRYSVVRIDGEGRTGWALGVFDGHGGAGTAHVASRIVEYAFRRSLEVNDSDTGAVHMTLRLVERFLDDRNEGSSGSFAWIDEVAGRVTIGVLGDSPVIVHGADGRTVIGPLHNTYLNPEDRDRAVERGAMFLGGYLVDPETDVGVNLTRTIGDASLTFLGREPETLSVDLGAGSYVVVGSDGVFTPVTRDPEALVSHIDSLVEGGADADAIVADAIANGSDDNVTAVLWISESRETSSEAPAEEAQGDRRSD